MGTSPRSFRKARWPGSISWPGWIGSPVRRGTAGIGGGGRGPGLPRPERVRGGEQTEPVQILYVEDNPTNLLLIDAVLRLHGFRTASARSAEEMYARLAASRPDLILMDVQLPGQDGLALTRALKADPATSSIPIVALTAHAMPEDRA